MKKKILCLAMAAIMAVGIHTTAFAETLQGGSDWKVEFNGSKMSSNFTSADMKKDIFQLQPGDTMELQVGLKNTSEKDADWYMTNEVLKSLEDSQSIAEGGAYGYKLTYVGPDKKETVLYDSETVGGEDAQKGEGLHQATDALDKYLYLDRLSKGDVASVHLTVKLDGETQGNDYQDTLAELKQQKEDLETAKEELLAAEQTKQEQKSKADSLVAAQQEKISAAKSDVADAETEIADTDAEIARQKAYEEELEAQKAKEDAARQEEIKRQEEELINSQQPAASDNNANPDGTSTGDNTTGSDASGGGTVNASDVAMLAALIQCEAGGESYEGKLAVGSVVMNRVDSSYFPDTVVGVIYQSGQFSPVASGRFTVVLSSGADASCVQAATEVLAGTRTLNCLYFRRNNGLINGTVIGNHVFY